MLFAIPEAGLVGPTTGRRPPPPASKRACARAILLGWLSDGRRVLATEGAAAIRAAGIGTRTYRHERRDLGVRGRRRGFRGPIEFYLPRRLLRCGGLHGLGPGDFHHGEHAYAFLTKLGAERDPRGGAL